MAESMTDDRAPEPVPAPEQPNLRPDGRDLGPERNALGQSSGLPMLPPLIGRLSGPLSLWASVPLVCLPANWPTDQLVNFS